MILLMVQKSHAQPPLGWLWKPYRSRGISRTNWWVYRISEPSTLRLSLKPWRSWHEGGVVLARCALEEVHFTNDCKCSRFKYMFFKPHTLYHCFRHLQNMYIYICIYSISHFISWVVDLAELFRLHLLKCTPCKPEHSNYLTIWS